MSYIQLIYNPESGPKTFKNHLDYVLEVFEKTGYELRIRRTISRSDVTDFIDEKTFDDCIAIIIAGGDGTINLVINSLKENGIDIPIGIIPAGTANDYANHIGVPSNIAKAIKFNSKLEYKELDLGKVNGKYFVNVCCGGILMGISHNIKPELKNAFGKLAYYIKGIQELTNIKPYNFRITTKENVYNEKLFFFLALNGSSAGGFNRIGEYASMKDGKLDFVGVRSCQPFDITRIFSKIMQGEHFNDKDVLYFRSEDILVELLDDDKVVSDIDGEVGPDYPLHISAIPKGVKVILDS